MKNEKIEKMKNERFVLKKNEKMKKMRNNEKCLMNVCSVSVQMFSRQMS